MKCLKNLKNLYQENRIINENQSKQRFFLEFFKELGYSNHEIYFEEKIKSPFSNTIKFSDVRCNNILIEVKSSNKPLNVEVLKQVFQYNQVTGADIIGITNFKEFEFFYKSTNNLILKFNLENYDASNIFKLLGKYTFKDSKTYLSYCSKITCFENIKKSLINYLNEYHKTNYHILPIIENNNIFISKILQDLFFLKNNSLELSEVLNEKLDDLFNQIYSLYCLQSNKYFPYYEKNPSPYNGIKEIFKFKESWLNCNFSDKLDTIYLIDHHFKEIMSCLNEIEKIDNNIKNWNINFWNLTEEYQLLGSLF